MMSRGFTLLEMLVVITLSSAVILFLAQSVSTMNRLPELSGKQSLARIQDDFNRLSRFLRSAVPVVSGSPVMFTVTRRTGGTGMEFPVHSAVLLKMLCSPGGDSCSDNNDIAELQLRINPEHSLTLTLDYDLDGKPDAQREIFHGLIKAQILCRDSDGNAFSDWNAADSGDLPQSMEFQMDFCFGNVVRSYRRTVRFPVSSQ